MTREDAKEKLKDILAEATENEDAVCYVTSDDADVLKVAIKALEQEPKTGRWMHPYKSDIACECSECHIQMPITKDFNYCPHCGAKMEVEE